MSLNLNPNAGDATLQRGIALHRVGRFAEAVTLYKVVLKQSPRHAKATELLGMAQTGMGQLDEGRRNIEKAIGLSPRTSSFHHSLAVNHRRSGHFAKAHEALDEAMRLLPGHLNFIAAKAEIYFMTGAFADCMRTLEPALPRAEESEAIAIMFGTVAPRVKREREAMELLARLLQRTNVAPDQRMKMLFALGALQDGAEAYDLAFASYARGNRIMVESGAVFDVARHRTAIQNLISAWTPAAIARLPKAEVDGSRALFIVGMPRSGTTLVEQILGTAPGVFPAGELNTMLQLSRDVRGSGEEGLPLVSSLDRLTRDALRKVARGYQAEIAKIAPSARLVLDKLPLNFLALGLIQQALPGAKVIHCRRDAMDTCLSCYFQLFDGNLPFAYDLAGVGHFFREYERLMAHWRSVLTLPILDVQYEELVADQEGMSRRLFDFAGVTWTDAALRFHESSRTALTRSNAQVRQPIFTRSVARHLHYEAHLAPLRDALAQA